MATFAKNERETLISRTKAGLARARAEGKVLGRPRVIGSKGHVGDLQAIRKLKNEGKSPRRGNIKRFYATFPLTVPDRTR
jgi:DNA invertase Pin-like site-specific DNA recombinase